MDLLRWTRMTLGVCGCVRPSSWSSSTLRILYNVYTGWVAVTVFLLLCSQISDVILVVDNTNDLIDNIFVSVSVSVAFYKMIYFHLNREMFTSLIDTLNREPFLPLTEEENGIHRKFNKLSEFNAKLLTIFIETIVVILCTGTLLTEAANRQLTFRAWLPYDYTSLPVYLVTFFYQLIGMLLEALLNISFDTLFSGLLIHTSCQLEILGCRLHNIPTTAYQSTNECIRHHESIYKFATKVNASFKSIMGFQFVASLSTICFNLYRLTQYDFGVEYIQATVVFSCYIMEILYYCWYGNEVKLKSVQIADVIFESDWITSNVQTQKMLMMIMRRSTVPIEYTSIHFVTMDLDSFMVLIKTSYSAYNMLTNTKN